MRIPLEPALAAYLHAQAATLISAGVRLIPLGQTDGQRVLAALEPVVAATAARALVTPLDEIGSAAFRADIASMRHETQYTRLFRLKLSVMPAKAGIQWDQEMKRRWTSSLDHPLSRMMTPSMGAS